MNIVKSGKYNGWGVHARIGKSPVAQRFAKQQPLDGSSIKSYEVVTQSTWKPSIGKAIGFGALLGPFGAVAGAVSGKNSPMLVKVEWSDGEKSLIEMSRSLFDDFVKYNAL